RRQTLKIRYTWPTRGNRPGNRPNAGMKTMGQGVDPGAGEGPADFDNRRQWTCRTILWPASIRLGGQVRYCHLRNLSLGGVRARAGADIALAEGTEITVDIPSRGTFSATVAWQGG